MNILILLLVLQNSISSGNCCAKTCHKFTYRPYIERTKYLVRLPNSLQLAKLSLIGSKSSLSSILPDEQRSQDLTLKQQLKYGVRVFDVEVSTDDSLAKFIITSSSLEINLDFDDLLEEFDGFLDDNPGELVILFLRSFDADNNCEVMSRYYNFRKAGRRLVDNWKLKDTLGTHRGGILLATLDPSFGKCAVDLNKCEVQSDSTVDNEGNLKIKWRNIHRFMVKSQRVDKQCFINDISFRDKENSRRTVARDAGYYSDGNCRRPINDILAYEFKRPRKGLAILFADFLTQELIDKINDANFPNSNWRIGWD